MVYSASFVEAFTLHNSQFYYLLRQTTGATIGLLGMLVALRLHYRIWKVFSVHLMALALVLLILVLVLPESLTMVNGSRSWIRLSNGLFSVQPSEIAKLAIVIYFASWLSHRSDKLGNVTYGLIPFAVILGLVCGLVALEPDTGTTVVLVVIAGAIYFAAGANLLHIVGAVGLGGLAFWAMVYLMDFQNGRIEAFKDPWKYYDSYGYQPIHALYALASGGIFGEGLGQARQKFQWLPQAHTDTILAIVGEELGLIGTLLVVVGFAIIAYRGYRIASQVRDPFAALLAVGITSWLVFQAFINMAVTTSLIPFTGLTLPFLSYGSTSLIMCMVSTGILLNISRHVEERQPEQPFTISLLDRSPALSAATQHQTRASAGNKGKRKTHSYARKASDQALWGSFRSSIARFTDYVRRVWGRDRRSRLSGTGSRRSAHRTTTERRRARSSRH
jgi:cell division protein FtsW